MVKIIDNNLTLSGTEMAGLSQELLARDASLRFRAKGFSMAPFIKNNDLVIIKPFNERRPHLGDVVLVQKDDTGTLLFHRVIKTGEDRILLKGDNCATPDGWFSTSSIIGIITKTYHTTTPIKQIIALLSRKSRGQVLHSVIL